MFEGRGPRILVFNIYYLPGYKAGGPIRTLANMIEHLGGEFNFSVITIDRDSGDLSRYADVEEGVWTTVGNARVKYMDRSSIRTWRLMEAIDEVNPDAIYLNSFFDSKFTQRILWSMWLGRIKVPIVVAPRGEFSQGARRIKRWRKVVYIKFCRALGLTNNLTWQASTSHEAADISAVISKNALIYQAVNLPPLPPPSVQVHRVQKGDNEPLTVCFLSRISPMKNLDFAVRVLSKVTAQVKFVIVGPVSDGAYWRGVKLALEGLPDNIAFEYLGEIPNSQVIDTLRGVDLFFLPTKGENYGHVIREALAAGVPVLISDRTPWGAVTGAGVGWAFPLSAEEPFVDVIEEVACWPADKSVAVSVRAREFVDKVTNSQIVIDETRRLLKMVCAQGKMI